LAEEANYRDMMKKLNKDGKKKLVIISKEE
jgi:hypothetical protein